MLQISPVARLLTASTRLEGLFVEAETHFLSAGSRDSARLLAHMMVDWMGSHGSPGEFAVHGVFPSVALLQQLIQSLSFFR